MTDSKASDKITPLADVLAELRIGRTKAYELINSGQLTRVRIGASVYITRDSIDQFVDGLPRG